MKVSELQPGYTIFGNKGNCWNNTCHISHGFRGTLCGTHALSNNWARIDNVQEIGCPECLEIYRKETGDLNYKDIEFLVESNRTNESGPGSSDFYKENVERASAQYAIIILNDLRKEIEDLGSYGHELRNKVSAIQEFLNPLLGDTFKIKNKE